MRTTSTLRLAFLALALGAALPAAAQGKLAFVDMDRALAEIDEAKAARAELEKDKTAKQGQLDGKKAEIEKMQKELQKQAMVLSDEVKAQKAGEIEARVVEVQKLMLRLQQELAQAEEKAMRNILGRSNDLLRDIAVADGLSMIVERRAVLYAEPSLDVTNELIRKYNAKFPAAAPRKAEPKPASAPAAAPKK